MSSPGTVNLVNLEQVGKAYGERRLLDGVSLGVSAGDRIGVVGRNGGGKTTLLRVLTRVEPADEGRVTHARGLEVGFLAQSDDFDDTQTVRGVVLGDLAEHEWAADPRAREVVAELLGGVDLDRTVDALSGGERRRVGLARRLLADHDLLVLDEPTNHLDVEVVDWLARHLVERAKALVVVTHDRWFLDAVCTRTWEVHDGRVDGYDGGYAAYVLAKAERDRQAAAAENRRRNLVRKELAWLQRGPPARTSKPKFRIDAANALIADEPDPRDRMQLQRFAMSRLGKDVVDLEDVTLARGGRALLDRSTWRLGPGDRLGLVGVNGSGKTTVLQLLAGEVRPDAGRRREGRTVRLAHLHQDLRGLDLSERVLASVESVRRVVNLPGGAELTATSMLERFGFTGDRLMAPIADLSGGERRRLQLLRLLMDEPNLLLLDEPTNDLDIETLTVLEDFLDGWPGTLVAVSHDRYFLERVCDEVWALLGDGSLVMLPRGVEEYLEHRRRGGAGGAGGAGAVGAAGAAGAAGVEPGEAGGGDAARTSAAQQRDARKEAARLERRLAKLVDTEKRLHEEMARQATDHEALVGLDERLREVLAEKESLEEAWLTAAEVAEG
jgi:ABC transport system ATP-binding/permease protein